MSFKLMTDICSNCSPGSSVILQGREAMATPLPILLHNPHSHPELCPNSVPLHRLLCALTVHHGLLPWNQMIRGSTFQKYQKTRSEPVLGSIPSWGTDVKLQFPYLLSEEVQTRCSMWPPSALKDLNLAPIEPAPHSPARKHGQFSTPKGLGGQND